MLPELSNLLYLVAMGRAGGGAAGDRAAVLPQAQAAAAGGALHLPLAQVDRRPARQLHLAAVAEQPAALSAASGGAHPLPGPVAADVAGPAPQRQPAGVPRRQLGQHAGHRRKAQPPGRGQAARRRADRPDALRRLGHARLLFRHGPRRTELHQQPPAAPRGPRRHPPQPALDEHQRGAPPGRRAGQPGAVVRQAGRNADLRHEALHLQRRPLPRRSQLRAGKPGADLRAHRPHGRGQRGHRQLRRGPQRGAQAQAPGLRPPAKLRRPAPAARPPMSC